MHDDAQQGCPNSDASLDRIESSTSTREKQQGRMGKGGAAVPS